MSINSEFAALYDRADAAGKEAANKCVPVPMVVVQRANPFDDNSPVVKRYEPVLDGVCGFAWIVVRPGNCPFANYLKRTGKGSKAYEGGVMVWVGDYNQSMARKEAYAYAFAEVLRDAGIKAYAHSRMD